MYLRDTDTQLLVTMHDCAVEGFVEDVRDPGTDVSEETDRVPDEVGRAQDTVQLAQDFLAIVIRNTALELRQSEPHVLDSKGIHLEWRFIDVAYRHSNCVQYHGEWIADCQPNKHERSVSSVYSHLFHLLLLAANPFRAHEGYG